jgi:hypothetical protein
MLDFVKECITVYQPHEVFVMDIALCGGQYYIIECGCINSVGVYAASIEDIVKSLTEYIYKNIK